MSLDVWLQLISIFPILRIHLYFMFYVVLQFISPFFLLLHLILQPFHLFFQHLLLLLNLLLFHFINLLLGKWWWLLRHSAYNPFLLFLRLINLLRGGLSGVPFWDDCHPSFQRDLFVNTPLIFIFHKLKDLRSEQSILDSLGKEYILFIIHARVVLHSRLQYNDI